MHSADIFAKSIRQIQRQKCTQLALMVPGIVISSGNYWDMADCDGFYYRENVPVILNCKFVLQGLMRLMRRILEVISNPKPDTRRSLRFESEAF